MSHYSVFEAGPVSEWKNLSTPHPAFARPVRGKFFLAEPLGLSGMEVSINTLPPKAAVPFVHAHREQEELYFFVAGQGEMWIDGETVAVKAGSAVRVAPEGHRTWRNTGDVALVYLVVQAKVGSLAHTTIGDGVGCPEPAPWS